MGRLPHPRRAGAALRNEARSPILSQDRKGSAGKTRSRRPITCREHGAQVWEMGKEKNHTGAVLHLGCAA